MDAVESGMAMSEALWVNLIATRCSVSYQLVAFVFVSALVTETKGRSLEQIEADLQQKARFASG
jgi:hypothetical protein